MSQISGQLTKVAEDLEEKNFTPGFLQYNTKYYWRVEVKDAQGNNNRESAISEEWEFTTMTDPHTPPEPPANPTPCDGQTEVATRVTLSWEQDNPEEKELMFDVYLGETTGVLDKIATGLTTPVLERSGLKYNTKYYWRVEVYQTPESDSSNEAGNPLNTMRLVVSSEEWEFTTVTAPLGPLQPPSNPNPTDGETGVETTVVLSWVQEASEERDLKYAIYLGKNSGSLSMIDGDFSATEYEVTDLDYNTTYYWRIEAWDVVGSEKRDLVTSDEWEFTTVAEPYTPPEPPATPTPFDKQTGVATSVTLSWEQNNPDSRALTYDVYFGTTSQNLDKIEADLTVREFEISDLEYDTTYYWRIDVKDTQGMSPARTVVSSEEWEFTTTFEPLDEPFSYDIRINHVYSFIEEVVLYNIVFDNVENGVEQLILTGNDNDQVIEVTDNHAEIIDYLVPRGAQLLTLQATGSGALIWEREIPLPQPMEVIALSLEADTALWTSYIVSLRLNFNEISQINDFSDLNEGEFISFRDMENQVLETVPITFEGESTSTTCTFKIFVRDITTRSGILQTDTSAYLEIEW